MIKKRLFVLFPEIKIQIIKIIIWKWLILLCNISFISYLAYILNELYLKQKINYLLFLFGFIIICLKLAFTYFANRSTNKVNYNLQTKLMNLLLSKLAKIQNHYQEHLTMAALLQLVSEGVSQLEVYFARYLPQLFYSLLAPITLFCYLALLNLKTAIILLVCVPLIPLSIVMVMKIAKRLLKTYLLTYHQLSDSFLDNLQGLSTLKTYQAEKETAIKMDQEAEKFRLITMKVLLMQLCSTTIMDIFAYGGAAVGMLVALNQYYHQQINFSATFIIIMLSFEFFIPLRRLGSYFHIATNGMAASDQMFKFLDVSEPILKSKSIKGEIKLIKFSNVSFSYNESRKILKTISLDFKPNTLTAIVGESGCGKSTIASLLKQQYLNYQGKITIDGEEIKNIDLVSLNNNITLVSNNSFLFKGTIKTNLLMGNSNKNDQELIEVLKLVNLHDLVNEKDLLVYPIKENGNNLSNGQRQRLAIARAILHDSLVYIFDEATSNIDQESEQIILDVIQKLRQHKTIIFITHCLLNVVNADYIYVLAQGEVKEQGNHQLLIKKKEMYYQMFKQQEELLEYSTKRREDETI